MGDGTVQAGNGQRGADLNVVLRDVVRGLLTELELSENKLATAWGISQRNVNRWLAGDHGLTVENLSTLCAALEINPVDLLCRHPMYEPKQRAKVRYAKDGIYDRFRTSLDLGEAQAVLKSIREQKRLGIFEICTETIGGIIKVAKAARARAFRDARASAGEP